MNIKLTKNLYNSTLSKKLPVFLLSLIMVLLFSSILQVQNAFAVNDPVTVITGTGGKSTDVITGTGGKPTEVITATGGKKDNKSVIENPLKVDSVDSLISLLVDLALSLGAVLSVLALIWVGVKFILAQGDPGKIADARKQFMYVIIGIALLFGAKVIVEILKATISPFVDVSQLGKKP